MNKNGKMNMQMVALVFIIAAAGFFAWKGGLFESSVATTTTTTTVVPGTPTSSGLVSCPSDGQTDVYVRARDGLSATSSYLANVVTYLKPVSGKTDGLVTLGTTTASTTGTMSAATAVTCSKTNPGVYRPMTVNYRVDLGDGVASVDYGKDVTIAENRVDFKENPPEIVTFATTNLQFRVNDEVSDAYLNCTSGTGYNDFDQNITHNLGNRTFMHNATCYLGPTGTSAIKAISNAGEYISVRIDVKSNASNKIFGQDDLKTYMCLDYDTSKWKEPIITIGGVQKTNVKSQLKEYDMNAIGSNWVTCYEIGTANGNTAKSIYLYGEASGNAADGFNVGFFAEGRYKSSRMTDTILSGIYTDAATQIPVFTSMNQEFVLYVT